MKKQTILHVGWGFYPWRKGGLILYARDLMMEQAGRGHRVRYFCAGRKLPFFKTPVLHTWQSRGVKTYEIINSPIIHRGDSGVLDPRQSLQEPVSEKLFSRVLEKEKPDLIHIHELAGLPSSLIDIAVQRFRIPCLMTLADYFLLCPSLKLYNHEKKENCTQGAGVGPACVACIEHAPARARNDILESVGLVLRQFELRFRLRKTRWWYYVMLSCYNLYVWLNRFRFSALRSPGTGSPDPAGTPDRKALARAYERRRSTNLERLGRIDCLVARSQKVQQIYAGYLGTQRRLRVVNPYLHHIDRILPKSMTSGIKRVRFATLNGFASQQKGGLVLTGAVAALNRKGYADRYEIHSFGGLQEGYKQRLEQEPNFFDHGLYEGEDLNDLLQPMHVGIVPSVWEEVFGYVGLELQAKGLPVIGSRRGGITDYVTHGVNGLLNDSCSVSELASCMEDYIRDPDTIVRHNRNILADTSRNYAGHYARLMDAYDTIISRGDSHDR